VLDQSNNPQELQRLLMEYNEHPERRSDIIAEIDRRFRQPLGILVMDSCGFTRTVHSLGIVHFLALLERLARLVTPIIERHGGQVLKREADNIYAIFPDAASAVRCAQEMLHYVSVANDMLPANEEVDISLGVGYGEVLVVGGNDMFGDEMNLACKLGEDLAEQHELLITPAAHDALGEAPDLEFEETAFNISGLQLVAFRLKQGD
jgi:class 3 adenylate cyclase